MKEKTNSTMLARARELRKSMTPQERKLWFTFLRYYPVRIYRQRIIGPYIADFFCFSAKLVIELDGSQHYFEDGESYDQKRTHYLEKEGIRVLRFSNYDVDHYFKEVCDMIDGEIQERLNPPPSPSVTPPPEGEARTKLGSPAGGAVCEAD